MAHVLTIPKIGTQAADEKTASLAAQLGLKKQAERYARACSVERDFVPMSVDEQTVWFAFCPKMYRSTREGELENYSFDTIPAEVIEYWARIKQNYAFDSFTIRTTEKVADPLLIGWFGQAAYLLARWGLESPEDLPLREVAKRVKHEYETEEWKYRAWNFLWIFPVRPYFKSHVWRAANRLAR
jgi:hypothetical protein